MKKQMLVATLLVAFAAQAETNTKTKEQSEIKLKKHEKVVTMESMGNREDKEYMATLTFGGIAHTASTSALEIGKYLDENSLATIKFTSLTGLAASIENDESSEGDKLWDEHLSGYAVSAGYKRFSGNSFYIHPEVYYRQQKYVGNTTESYNSTTDTWTLTDSETGDFSDLGVSFRIGNQWQWKNFTLGCDWVGLSRSIMNTVNGEVDTIVFGNNISLLNVYLGASF